MSEKRRDSRESVRFQANEWDSRLMRESWHVCINAWGPRLWFCLGSHGMLRWTLAGNSSYSVHIKQYCPKTDAIQFGRQSYYETRTPPYFAVPCRFRLAFTQRFFRSKATYWWNNLPSYVFNSRWWVLWFQNTDISSQHLLDSDSVTWLFLYDYV